MGILKKLLIFTVAFLVTLSLFSFTQVYAAADFNISDMENGSFEIVFDSSQDGLDEENFHISYQIDGGDKQYFEDIEISPQGSGSRIFLVEYKKLPTYSYRQLIEGEVYYSGAGSEGFEFAIEGDNSNTGSPFRITNCKNGSLVVEFDEGKSNVLASDFRAYLYINNVRQGALSIDSVRRVSGYSDMFELFFDEIGGKSYTQNIRVEVSYRGSAEQSGAFKVYDDGRGSSSNDIEDEYSYLDAAEFSIVDIENGQASVRFDYDILRELTYRDFSAKYYLDGDLEGDIDFTAIEESDVRHNREFTLFFDPIDPIGASGGDVEVTLLIFYDREEDMGPDYDSFTVKRNSTLKETDISIEYVGEFKDYITLPPITITEMSKNTISQSTKSQMEYIKLELPDGFEWSEAGDVTGTDGLSEVIDYEIEYGEGSKYGEKNILLIGIINSEANRARAGSLIIDGLELKAAGEAPLGEVKLRVSGAGIPYERFTVAKFTYNPSQSRSGASYTVKLVDGFSQMSVNDSDLVMDTEPYILNNRFMLPVSYVAVAFGIPPTYDNIKWDGENRTVTVIDGDNEIKLSIGSKVMFVNGGPFEMDTTAVIQDNRTFVPMRALAEALGFDVEWDGQTRTAILTK